MDWARSSAEAARIVQRRQSWRKTSTRRSQIIEWASRGLLKGFQLFRRHSQRAVQANHFAVEHFIFEDMFGKRSEFRGVSQSRWKRNLLAEHFFDVFRKPRQKRGIEQSRRDRYNADPGARQVAR